MIPRNFSYLVPSRIAGSGHPGYGPRLAQTLAALREEGIRAILTVHEEPLEDSMLREFELEALHLPVRDFGAPTLEQILKGIAFIREHARGESRVLVHCWGGYGRTGTLLACYLVHEGMPPGEAIEEVRRLRPGSIEDPSQEQAIHQYAQHLRDAAKRQSQRGEG